MGNGGKFNREKIFDCSRRLSYRGYCKSRSKDPWWSMRGGFSTSVEAVDDFILKTHTFAKLRHALKNRMNIKISSNYKEFSHEQKKMHEQYIQQLLINIPIDPFHGPARNIMSGLEISS